MDFPQTIIGAVRSRKYIKQRIGKQGPRKFLPYWFPEDLHYNIY